jgi:hypothetical protein
MTSCKGNVLRQESTRSRDAWHSSKNKNPPDLVTSCKPIKVGGSGLARGLTLPLECPLGIQPLQFDL